jgi:hypothetical protein
MRKLDLKESSFISEAFYDEERQELTVYLHSGKAYCYLDVDVVVVNHWESVSRQPKGSVGSVYNALVKEHDFVKVFPRENTTSQSLLH